jgi:transcriptional regulator with XRE-family HTH domain
VGKRRSKRTVPPAPDTLAGAIAARMNGLNLTAYRVAEMSGVHVSVIQRLINGERFPKLDTADRICKSLELALAILPDSTLALDLVRDRNE